MTRHFSLLILGQPPFSISTGACSSSDRRLGTMAAPMRKKIVKDIARGGKKERLPPSEFEESVAQVSIARWGSEQRVGTACVHGHAGCYHLVYDLALRFKAGGY